MKHLRTYNESLRDHMKGKSDDDMRKILSKLPIEEWIKKIKIENLDSSLMPIKSEIIKILDNLNDSDKIIKILELGLSFDLLPNNLIVDGSLNCDHKQLTELPNNLTLNGNFRCSNNLLTELPKGLVVNGYLDCSYNKLIKLSDDLKVKDNLYCINNQLTSLPDNLKVGQDVHCKYNPLPKDIKKPIGVKGKIII